jgi:hypothetical protein
MTVKTKKWLGKGYSTRTCNLCAKLSGSPLQLVACLHDRRELVACLRGFVLTARMDVVVVRMKVAGELYEEEVDKLAHSCVHVRACGGV